MDDAAECNVRRITPGSVILIKDALVEPSHDTYNTTAFASPWQLSIRGAKVVVSPLPADEYPLLAPELCKRLVPVALLPDMVVGKMYMTAGFVHDLPVFTGGCSGDRDCLGPHTHSGLAFIAEDDKVATFEMEQSGYRIRVIARAGKGAKAAKVKAALGRAGAGTMKVFLTHVRCVADNSTDTLDLHMTDDSAVTFTSDNVCFDALVDDESVKPRVPCSVLDSMGASQVRLANSICCDCLVGVVASVLACLVGWCGCLLGW